MGEKLSLSYCLIIILFGVIAPTMDQVSDLALVIRLMSGPEQNITLNSGAEDINIQKIIKPDNCRCQIPHQAAVQYNISEPATNTQGNVYSSK